MTVNTDFQGEDQGFENLRLPVRWTPMVQLPGSNQHLQTHECLRQVLSGNTPIQADLKHCWDLFTPPSIVSNSPGEQRHPLC